MLLAGFLALMTAIIGDLISVNRKLIEEVLLRVRRIELGEFAKETKEADPKKQFHN